MSSAFAASEHLELLAGGFSFPTSLTFDEAGTIYVVESGLPFGGAQAGGRVWRLEGDGNRRLIADHLRPPVNGLTYYQGNLYLSEGGHPGRISRLTLSGEGSAQNPGSINSGFMDRCGHWPDASSLR